MQLSLLRGATLLVLSHSPFMERDHSPSVTVSNKEIPWLLWLLEQATFSPLESLELLSMVGG